MNEFEMGFIKYAEDYVGMSEAQARHIFKRAMDYPGSQAMFKNLMDEGTGSTVQASQGMRYSPDELDVISQLMQQKEVEEQMNAVKKKISI